MTEPSYIVIQAGGKGTRLKHHTMNKPKAIVSVENLPIIFHLFRKYPNKKYIIIGDYKKDVLDRYLETFCDVQYLTVGVDGNEGTCAGIKNALEIIPSNEKFLLIWSDLILGNTYKMPVDDYNYIGLSGTFSCRWKYEDGTFEEERSDTNGVAGFFIFEDKSVIRTVPESGEFVKWLKGAGINFKETLLKGAEYGLVETIKPLEGGKCRPFNAMTEVDGKLIKRGIDDQGRKLAEREIAWYRHVEGMDVPTPKIYSYCPLTMEIIDGKNIFEYYEVSDNEKRTILHYIVEGLNNLHQYDKTFPDRYSIQKAYYTKTVDRLQKVRNLIPFANEEYITINGRKCKNIFFELDEMRERVSKLPCFEFCLIHGDCTFSNMLLRNDKKPVFIDPRGYFGDSELVGDPLYDWAKLYYSLYGDYDQFNLGRFELKILENNVELRIETNGWKNLEDEFIAQLPANISIDDVRFIHAIIWLSLTTYAWNDYDSVCGAFYNGLYHMEGLL